MGKKSTVVFENDKVRILKRSSVGHYDPAKIRIEMLQLIGKEPYEWIFRKLDLTVDELFELTNALDDLCDEIEDRENNNARKY